MTHEEKRHQRLQLLDDHIGRSMRDTEASGELQAAACWGKPLDFGDGYEETPAELRMAFKMLKDAGVVPPEVDMLHRLAALRQELVAAAGDAEREQALRQRIATLQVSVQLRLDSLRVGNR